jgi:hypothetical protein
MKSVILMKKNNLTFLGTVICITLAISYVLSKDTVLTVSNDTGVQNNDTHNIVMLFLDRSDFSCQFCLNSFLQLCDTLQTENFNKIIIRGILDGSEINDDEEKLKRDRILKKQIRGFVKGNNIHFPFYIDSSHVFRKIKDKDTAVIVLNNSLGVIRQWPSPLSYNDICDICSFASIN